MAGCREGGAAVSFLSFFFILRRKLVNDRGEKCVKCLRMCAFFPHSPEDNLLLAVAFVEHSERADNQTRLSHVHAARLQVFLISTVGKSSGWQSCLER